MQDGIVIADPLSPAQGLARERDGRETAFAALVRRQSRFVFKVAYTVLRNVDDADDVVQETFLKLYRSGAWQKIADERAFLARTAWRTAVGKLRGAGRQRPMELAGPEPHAPGANPEEAAVAADSLSIIHRYIDGLPEDLRLPLALSTVEELNSREIARVMGLPEGTVRTRLLRARQLLKEKLTRGRDRHHEK